VAWYHGCGHQLVARLLGFRGGHAHVSNGEELGFLLVLSGSLVLDFAMILRNNLLLFSTIVSHTIIICIV
jgi:hypothetical protein